MEGVDGECGIQTNYWFMPYGSCIRLLMPPWPSCGSDVTNHAKAPVAAASSAVQKLEEQLLSERQLLATTNSAVGITGTATASQIDASYPSSPSSNGTVDATVAAGTAGNGSETADAAAGSETTESPHIMLSYEWGSQKSVLLVKSELDKAGYKVLI